MMALMIVFGSVRPSGSAGRDNRLFALYAAALADRKMADQGL
jgi:hypothetical protein